MHYLLDLIHELCDCIANVLHKTIPVASQQKDVLERTKNGLGELVVKSRTIPRKRKLLVQHWGGISKVILDTVINAIGSLRLFR